MAESCPKCGYAQVETDECPRCRVILSKYRAYLQKVGQPAATPLPPSGATPGPPSPGEAPPPVPVERGLWPEGSPAGFWIRGAALVVDGLVIAAVLLPFILFILVPTLVAGGIRRPDPAYAAAVFGGYAVVGFVVQAGYSVWMHGRWGQTLGKVATGVKVVKAGGEPIGYGRALGRWFVPFVFLMPLYLGRLVVAPGFILGVASFLCLIAYAIGFLIAGIRSDKRALHDLVAGTRVMKVRRPWLEGKPSGFWMRFTALVVDWYVLGFLLGAPFWIIIAVTTPVMVAGRVQQSAAAAVLLTFGLFYFAFTIAYSIWMHGKWGQTLGKRALGMTVVRRDGSRLKYGRAFIRWLGSVLWAALLPIGSVIAGVMSDKRVLLLSGILSFLIWLIGYVMAGLRSDKRALHDLVAGSRVTYSR
ncbi:MAG: RDD family protein [Candidatus Rokubacteria bacterium]|nr:RDD family protein [Candidatus Rokubacteria bacterium]